LSMPKGPKGEVRPAHVIGNAVKAIRILTGEEPEHYGDAPSLPNSGGSLSMGSCIRPAEFSSRYLDPRGGALNCALVFAGRFVR
jgi:hypothetical protein